MVEIASFTAARDTGSLACVSGHWHKQLDSERLWKRVFYELHGKDDDLALLTLC